MLRRALAAFLALSLTFPSYGFAENAPKTKTTPAAQAKMPDTPVNFHALQAANVNQKNQVLDFLRDFLKDLKNSDQPVLIVIIISVNGKPVPGQEPPNELPAGAQALVASLQASDQIETFNKLYGTNISSTGNVPAADVATLSNTAGDPNFNLAAFNAALPKAGELYAALQADEAARASFNKLYGTSFVATGSPDADDRKALFDTAGGANFDQANYLNVLGKASSLHAAVTADAETLSKFNSRYDSDLAATGPVSAGDRTRLFNLAGDPNFNLAAFLDDLNAEEPPGELPGEAQALVEALQVNDSALNYFNSLFGTNLPASGAPAVADRKPLFDVAGDPNFNLTTFLSVLDRTGSLLAALQGDATSLSNFNTRFGSSLTATGVPSTADRSTLFGLAGDPNFNLAAFLADLNGTEPPAGQLPPAAQALVTALVSGGQISAFNQIYGTTISSTGAVTVAAEVQLLADLTGDPNFNLGAFTQVLPKTAGLYSALQADPARRSAFNSLFGTNLPASGAPAVADRKPLFDVAGDPNFNLTTFLSVLDRTGSLLAALQGDATSLSNFNTRFGSSLTATGVPSTADRSTLFGLAGDPNFNLAAFLADLNGTEPPAGQLPPAAQALVTAMQNGSQIRNFNTVFGTSLPNSGAPTSAADIQLLADLTGDPAFDQQAFLAVLPKAAALLTALQDSQNRMAAFSRVFDASVPSGGAPRAEDRGPIFDISGAAEYDQSSFLNALDRTANLHAALTSDARLQERFNAQYGTTLGSGPLTAADRTRLFGIAGDPSFNLHAFIGSLSTAPALATSLRTNPLLA